MDYKTKQLDSRLVFFTLAGLILFVIVLSITVFSKQSLRLDESQSLWQTSHTPTKILNIIAQDVHVPLYHMMLHFWQLFLGNTVPTGRALSLIFFVLSIPALYLLGTRAFNQRVALFATLLFAISPFMNWYGNEMRMYSLLTLATILSQYFYIGIYKFKNTNSWIGYFLVGILGIFVHYFFWFVLVVQAIYYFLYSGLFPKGTLKKFILIAVIYLIAYAPWVWYVHSLGTLGNESPLLSVPTTVNVFNTFSQFLFGFQNDHLNTILVSLWPLTVLLGFLALRENQKVMPESIYMILSFIIPIAAAFLVSVFLTPLFVSRYLILTIPSMYLLIGWIFSTYPPSLRKIVETVLVVVMIGTLIVEIVSPVTPVKEDYRDAVSYLDTHAAPQDVIVLSAPFTVYPIEYYYKGHTDIETLPLWNRFISGPIPAFNEADLPNQMQTIAGSHQDAWILLSYDQGYENNIKQYLDSHYQRLYVHQYSDDLTLYEYKLRYDPPILQAFLNQSTTTISDAVANR